MVRHPVPLASLLEGLPYTCVQGDVSVPVTAICEHSHSCQDGALFVAVRGHSQDGHDFIAEALRRGVRAVLCEAVPSEPLPSECTVVCVPNSRAALSWVAHRFYGEPSSTLRLIGITGTNGKTTTSFFLCSVLERAGIATGLIGTTGAIFGQQRRMLSHTTPAPVELNALLAWMRNQGAEAVVMEVSSHALAQHRVDALRFAAAVFTNLTHEHLDYHGTMEAYASAKRRLFELLPAEAVALAYESGDGWGSWMVEAATPARRYRLGSDPEMDFQLQLDESTRSGIRWRLRFPDGWREFRSRLLGAYNAVNASLAVALGWIWGIEGSLLQEAVAQAEAPPGRMEPIALPNGALALVDYAHTPDALERALRALRPLLPEGGRLFCVFGCGGNRDRAKRPLMGAIAVRWADIVVLTTDNPRHEAPEQIVADIRAGIPSDRAERVLCLLDREAALRTAVELSTAGDIILVAGKGHEQYQVVGDTAIPFSDRALLETIAQQMRSSSPEEVGTS